MTKLYLITGFLGAGKTTFLKKFVPLFPDKKIALVINDFGVSSVDGKLLADFGASLDEIANGSIFCNCRIEQFENVIMKILAEIKPDLIFVEASGLADPTSVRNIFSQPIYENMEYAGAICLVDASKFHKIYASTSVSKMQLAISDLVLINRTDLASKDQINEIITLAKAQKPQRPVYETTFGEFRAEWLDSLNSGDALAVSGEPVIHTRDITLAKVTLEVAGFTKETLTSFLKMIAHETYRIKGFIKTESQCCLVDCVGPLVDVREYEGHTNNEGQLTILYGKGLHAKSAIKDASPLFSSCIVKIL